MNFSALKDYLDTLEQDWKLPGYELIAMQDHQVIFRYLHGTSDHKRERKLTGDELYDVYSATKIVTMTAVMQLVEQGKISLDQSITDFFPEFVRVRVLDSYDMSAFPYPKLDLSASTHTSKAPILLRNLMTMTSGMSYDLDNSILQPLANENADTKTIVAAMARMPLLFEPGQRYRYSLGHDVMAAVVEKVSGEPFGEYLDRHIFAPLGLKDMYLRPGTKEQQRMMEKWQFHAETGDVHPISLDNAFRLGSSYDSGGAGLCCKPEEYAVFLDALACGGLGYNGEQILKPESVAMLSAPQLTPQQEADFGRGTLGYSYGLGVRTLVYPERSHSPLGEFGWDGAAGAYALVDPANRISLFFATEVMSMRQLYFEVHPVIRDRFYDCIRD